MPCTFFGAIFGYYNSLVKHTTTISNYSLITLVVFTTNSHVFKGKYILYRDPLVFTRATSNSSHPHNDTI